MPTRRGGGERGAGDRSYRPAAHSPGGARGKSIRTRGCPAVAAPSRAQSTPGSGLLRAPRRRKPAGPITGHEARRRNYAAARLTYAAASATALSKSAAVAGVAVLRRGPRRTSSKYAAAARLVKRRSPAWAGTGAVCTPATGRGSDCLGSQGVAADRDRHGERKGRGPGNGTDSSSRALEKPGAAVVYFPCFLFDRIGLSSPRRGHAVPHSSSP